MAKSKEKALLEADVTDVISEETVVSDGQVVEEAVIEEVSEKKHQAKKSSEEELDEFEVNKIEEEPIIKMRDVKISFKMGTMERIVINHLNLDIKRGEILGLVGESGSGKTTIGRALIRVNQVTAGEILYNNVPISGKIPRSREKLIKKKIQMVFQDPGDSLNERANIDYIVSEGLRANHLYKTEEERIQKVEDIMQKVGLRVEFLNRFPHEFSGGQRQRIGIARCMVMDPEFVIADEPISALDVSIRAQVLNLIKQFQQERNMTVLFIAHDLSVVRYISDRIAVIYAGKIVELAEANRLFEVPLHPYTKALLTAVPIPDPEVEKKKQILVYNPKVMHNYTRNDQPQLVEIEPGHWVRCDTKEKELYEKELAEKIAQLAKKKGKEDKQSVKKVTEKGVRTNA